MTRKIEKVNELIKEVVSDIIHRHVQFPEGTLVTVTRVLSSPDLHYANIFVTIFSPDKTGRKETVSRLRSEIREIQHGLNRALRMRPVPRIAFVVDEEEEKRERVEELLAEDRRNSNHS